MWTVEELKKFEGTLSIEREAQDTGRAFIEILRIRNEDTANSDIVYEEIFGHNGGIDKFLTEVFGEYEMMDEIFNNDESIAKFLDEACLGERIGED